MLVLHLAWQIWQELFVGTSRSDLEPLIWKSRVELCIDQLGSEFKYVDIPLFIFYSQPGLRDFDLEQYDLSSNLLLSHVPCCPTDEDS